MAKDFETIEENPRFKGVFDIEPEEVFRKKGDLCLIDVRRDEEFHGELGHVPGSQLLVLDDLPDEIENLDKDKEIIFICRSGNRSAQATAYALQNGFSKVYNMKGGMLLWNELNLETEK